MVEAQAEPVRRPPRWMAWTMLLMFVVPAATALAMHGLAREFGGAPGIEASFQPSGVLAHVGMVLALPYTAAFMVIMNRARHLMPPLPKGRRPQKGDITVGSIWLLGIGLWILTFCCLALGVGGAVNEMVGTVTTEPGRIWIKRVKQGKGCHREIGIISATVPEGENLCVPPDDWDRLEEGDSLPVVSIISGLGSEVGLAPGALANVTKRIP